MRYDSPYERMMGLHLYQANTDLGNKATAAPKAESTPLPDLEGSMVSTPDDSMAVATAEPPQTFGSFVQENWLPLAGALVGLALIATVLAVLLRRRKKPGAEPVGAAAPEPITEVPDDMPTDGASTVMMRPDVQLGVAQHIGKRSDQQDSWWSSQAEDAASRGLLAVVADGMGGMANGGAISQMAVRTIAQGFTSLPMDKNPPLQLVRLAGSAHRAICSMPSAGSGGSTLVMAYVLGDSLYTLSIGDSRIYLLRDHTLMQLNREHNYAVELDEKAALGEIPLEAALNDPQRKALTSYLGMDGLNRIDRTVRPFPLRDGDRIALMSDGVFGTIGDGELKNLLELPPEIAAQEIQQAVLRKNAPRQDNMTVIVVQYH